MIARKGPPPRERGWPVALALGLGAALLAVGQARSGGPAAPPPEAVQVPPPPAWLIAGEVQVPVWGGDAGVPEPWLVLEHDRMEDLVRARIERPGGARCALLVAAPGAPVCLALGNARYDLTPGPGERILARRANDGVEVRRLPR